MSDIHSHLRGVICATVTPFERDGTTILWDGVESNARWLVEHGVRTLVVNGSIGEYAWMEPEVRTRLIGATVAAVDGNAAVIAGCSDNALPMTLRLCRAAKEAGAVAAMLLPPNYFKLSAKEIVRYFRAIDSAIDLPFLVYNNPGTARMDIPLEALEELAGCDHFAGLKEANPSVRRFHDVAERFGREFPVIAASEPSLFSALAIGTSGCLTASAAFAPELLESLMRAFEASDLVEARRLFAKLRAFRALLQPALDRGYPAYIPYTKAAMNLVGLVGGYPGHPLLPLDDAETERLRRVLEDELGLAVSERAVDAQPA